MDDTTFTPEQIEAARKLFAGPVAFVMGAVSISAMPPSDRPEIAFAGRSNVGKSSLINALCNRKNLARASNTPGRTQEINFFDLAEGRLYLVDPLGNLMMSYERGAPVKGLLDDLKKLLNLSHIG